MTSYATHSRELVHSPGRGASYYLTRSAGFLLLAAIPVGLTSTINDDHRPVEFYFDYLSTPFLLVCALTEAVLSHRSVQIFAPGEPLRAAWKAIRVAAVFHAVGLLFRHVLGSDLTWNPLLYTGSLWNEQLAARFQAAGYVISGALRLSVLAVGLGLALRTMSRSIPPRVTLLDYALLGPVALFACSQTFLFAQRVVEARAPETLATLTDGANNPLLTILLLEALMMYRSLREMGGGLISRCWGALAVGIVLTCLGVLGQWATDYGYLPRPYSSVVWYVWIPAAAAYALAPAYQLEAAWALRIIHLKPEPSRKKRGAKRHNPIDPPPRPRVVENPGVSESAARAWEETLARTRTVLGKLVMASESRIEGSPDYSHTALRDFPASLVTRTIGDSHNQLFTNWLRLGFEEQHKDLVEYLESVADAEAHKAFFRHDWGKLVPPSAKKAERLLFETDLAVVLELTEPED